MGAIRLIQSDPVAAALALGTLLFAALSALIGPLSIWTLPPFVILHFVICHRLHETALRQLGFELTPFPRRTLKFLMAFVIILVVFFLLPLVAPSLIFLASLGEVAGPGDGAGMAMGIFFIPAGLVLGALSIGVGIAVFGVFLPAMLTGNRLSIGQVWRSSPEAKLKRAVIASWVCAFQPFVISLIAGLLVTAVINLIAQMLPGSGLRELQLGWIVSNIALAAALLYANAWVSLTLCRTYQAHFAEGSKRNAT